MTSMRPTISCSEKSQVSEKFGASGSLDGSGIGPQLVGTESIEAEIEPIPLQEIMHSNSVLSPATMRMFCNNFKSVCGTSPPKILSQNHQLERKIITLIFQICTFAEIFCGVVANSDDCLVVWECCDPTIDRLRKLARS